MTTRPKYLHDAIDLIADAYGIDRAALADTIDKMEAEVYKREAEALLGEEYPRFAAFVKQWNNREVNNG